MQPGQRLGNDDLSLAGLHDRTCKRLPVNTRQHLRTHDDMAPEVVAFGESDEEIALDVKENRFIKSASLVKACFFGPTEVVRSPSHFPAKSTRPFLNSGIFISDQWQSNGGAPLIVQAFERPESVDAHLGIGVLVDYRPEHRK